MLHLLPIRTVLTAIIVLVALAVLAAVYADVVGTGDAFSDAKLIFRTASAAAVGLMLVPYAAWRWVSHLQHLVFPYLGGEWSGKLEFQGPKGSGTRDVTLTVRHSPLRIVLVLDSAESTSRTLAVHAERDADINRDRLYYVYLNERKEGVPGAGDRYRGLAVLRIEMSGDPTLFGDYFTERLGTGKLHLTQLRPHPWWALWK